MIRYIFLLFIFCNANAFAQNKGNIEEQFKFIKYTNADGLNHLECLAIEENNKGEYFIATQDGMNIMDGTGIRKLYTTDRGVEFRKIIAFDKGFIANEKSKVKILLEKNRVKYVVDLDPNKILIDHSDMVPCGADSVVLFAEGNKANYSKTGIIYFNVKNRSFTNINFINKDVKVKEAKDDLLLVLENNNNKHIYYLYKKDVIIDSLIFDQSNISLKNGVLYNNKGLFLQAKIASQKIVLDTVFNFVVPQNATYLKCFPNSNTLLFVDKGKLYIVLNGQLIMLANFTPFINDAYIDNQNNLWLCTSSGLYNFYKCGVKTILFKGAAETENQIDYMSKYGNEFRFSSIFSGFLKSTDNLNTWQRNTALDLASRKYVSSDIIRGRSGNVKTVDGLEINPLKNALLVVKNSKITTIVLSNNDDDKIAHIIEDVEKHKCYIVSYLSVFELDNYSLKVTKLIENDSVEKNGYFVDIILDIDGIPLIASRVVQKLLNGKLETIKPNVSFTTNHFAKDKENNIWIGQDHKLFIYKPNTNKVIYVADIPNATIINSCAIYKDWLVMGTWYELIFFNKTKFFKNGEIDIKKFGKAQGLKTIKGGVHSVLADEEGNCVYWPCNDMFYKVYPEIIFKNYVVFKEPIIKSIFAINEKSQR